MLCSRRRPSCARKFLCSDGGIIVEAAFHPLQPRTACPTPQPSTRPVCQSSQLLPRTCGSRNLEDGTLRKDSYAHAHRLADSPLRPLFPGLVSAVETRVQTGRTPSDRQNSGDFLQLRAPRSARLQILPNPCSHFLQPLFHSTRLCDRYRAAHPASFLDKTTRRRVRHWLRHLIPTAASEWFGPNNSFQAMT